MLDLITIDFVVKQRLSIDRLIIDYVLLKDSS